MRNVTAVILGGGRGSRLMPLTLKRAKPAVGLAGKYRIIDIPISNCINSQIRKIFVVTQFMSVSLHRHIMRSYSFDSFSGGFIDILAAEQTQQRLDWFQGTADAVRGTLSHVTHQRSDATLILSGDHLYRMDYQDLVGFHLDTGADITLAVHPVPQRAAEGLGLLRVDELQRVMELIEKPVEPANLERFRAPERLLRAARKDRDEPHYLASMGIYVFNPAVLADMLTGSDQTDFGREVIPTAIADRRVLAYPFFGYWRDIGTVPSYFDANISLAQAEPPFHLYEPNWPTYTRSRSLPPCRVVRSDIIDSLLTEGSSIQGATIEDSIVGLRGVVSPGSKLREVIFMGADFFDGDPRARSLSRSDAGLPPLGVGRDCQIERAIIDKNARIGDGVVIRRQPDDHDVRTDTYWVRDGITVIPKSAVIPAGTVI